MSQHYPRRVSGIVFLLIAALFLSACTIRFQSPIATRPDGYWKLQWPMVTVPETATVEAGIPADPDSTSLEEASDLPVNQSDGSQTVPGAYTGDGPYAQEGGYTDCPSFEEYVIAQQFANVPRQLIGTEQYPIDYSVPGLWVGHDSCFGFTGMGSGNKWGKVPGPAVIQRGEQSPLQLVKVYPGEIFEGSFQAAFHYNEIASLEGQWFVENQSVGLFGQICGYSRMVNMRVPAFRFQNGKLDRDESLDCPLSDEELFGQIASNGTGSGGGADATYGLEPYVQFKVEAEDGTFWCGFRNLSTAFPANTRVVEDWKEPEYQKHDLGFTRDPGDNGMTTDAGFCKGQPVDGSNQPVAQTVWETGYLTPSGEYQAVVFPLP